MSIKQYLQRWLDVEHPKNYDESLKQAVKDFREQTDKIEKEMWKHRVILRKKVTEKCDVCGKGIVMWPLNDTESYYIRKDDGPRHIACGSLAENKK